MDRISLAFPVRSWSHEEAAWDKAGVRLPGTDGAESELSGVVDVARGCKAFVGVREVAGRGGEAWAKVEFNPSRWVDPEGASLAPVGELRGAVAAALDAASGLVEAAGPRESARVTRLDVARDFEGVSDPGRYVRGLAPIRRPWARRSFVYNDPSKGNAETLFVGSASGGVRLYDKRREAGEKVAEGTVRWEVEGRRRWLDRIAGITTMATVCDEAVGAIAANRWEWSAMGMEVSATDRVVDVARGSELSGREQAAFIGFCVLESLGASDVLGRSSQYKYRRVARDAGLVLEGGEFQQTSPGFVGRLDFDSGRELVRAA